MSLIKLCHGVYIEKDSIIKCIECTQKFNDRKYLKIYGIKDGVEYNYELWMSMEYFSKALTKDATNE